MEYVLLPILHRIQRIYERPTDGLVIPNLGKGQIYTSGAHMHTPADIRVSTSREFISALKDAKPGQIIELTEGTYLFTDKIKLGAAGASNAPITVRAGKVGGTVLEFNSLEGFLVDQPYWIFEDFIIRGKCTSDDQNCEHAFHVVGKAEHTKIINNYIEDFNAHIKVNGFAGDWPDYGLVKHNTLTNTRVRQTRFPVTLFDLVGANHWELSDNLVTNFVKGDGNLVSFGIFMKGASEGGTIVRNLVICSPNNISQPGVRVGISFGGGGTSPTSLCRDGSCSKFEHRGGIAANNIVAHCNDSGLDINNSSQIILAFNTLINTSGMDIRRSPAKADFYGNLYEGNVRSRDGAVLKQEFNQSMRATDLFQNADELNLQWISRVDNIPSLREVKDDFCGHTRADGTLPGALSDIDNCRGQGK